MMSDLNSRTVVTQSRNRAEVLPVRDLKCNQCQINKQVVKVICLLFLPQFLVIPHLKPRRKPLNDSFGSEYDPTSGIRAWEEVFCRLQLFFIISSHFYTFFSDSKRFHGRNLLKISGIVHYSTVTNPGKFGVKIKSIIGSKRVPNQVRFYGITQIRSKCQFWFAFRILLRQIRSKFLFRFAPKYLSGSLFRTN